MGGRKEFRDEAWYGGKTNNVPLDLKTAFDEAEPKHVSNILDSQNTATRKRGGTSFAAENGNPDLGRCGGGMDEEKKWCSLGRRWRRSTPNMSSL